MATVIETLRNRARAASTEALGEYWKTVVASARNEELDPDAVITAVENAGLDLERFESDVVSATHRLRLQARLVAMPAAQAELEQLQADMAVAQHEFRKAKAIYDQQAARLTPLIMAAQARVQQGMSAEVELRRDSRNPALVEAEQQALTQIRIAGDALRTAQSSMLHHAKDITNAETLVKSCEESLERHLHADPAQVRALQTELDQARDMLADRQRTAERSSTRLAELEADYQVADAALQAVNAAKLLP